MSTPALRPRHCLSVLIATALAGMVFAARAAPSVELAGLVNRLRAAPAGCDSRTAAPLAPLQVDAALERVVLRPGASLPAALERAGYLFERAQAIVVSGAGDAERAMDLLRQRYCPLLRDPGFSRLAATRSGHEWQVLLARPLLAPDLAPWRNAGREVLARVNAARAQPRQCGSKRFGAAGALRWNDRLGDAAFGHSQDMARHDYFDHVGRDGSGLGQRAQRSGYRGRRLGENIAAGQGDEAAVVAGWVASPGHCANLMDPGFTEMGAAYAVDGTSRGKIYWTQVFGTPL